METSTPKSADELIPERSSIPYRFMAIPYDFLTKDFLNDHKMLLFIICILRRISTHSKTIPLKNHCKQLILEPFEFMFGRKSFAKEADISEKAVRTRLNQLIGLGYVTEVVEKGASTFSVYKLVTASLQQVKGRGEVQHLESNQGPNLGHKRETKAQEQENVKETFNVKTSLSKEENEAVAVILTYCDANEIKIQKPSLERWVKKYGVEKVTATISLMLLQKSQVKKPEAWLEMALKDDYVEKNIISDANAKFADEFKKSHAWNDLTITKRYCRHEPSGKEYYFNLPQENFREYLKNCREQW